MKMMLDQLHRQRIYFEIRNPGLANLVRAGSHRSEKDKDKFVKRVECYEVG